MAGSKHGRSGGSGGAGEVSPLASQLQQAWLQTQMPKAPKRIFTSATNFQSAQPSLTSTGAESQRSERPSALSALKSLSTLFPELANVPEEKKAMIFSVFEDGEEPSPIDPELKEKKAKCLNALFGENFVQKKTSQLKASPNQRSLSASVVQHSSDSSEFSELAHLSTSYSFSGSGSSQRTTPGSSEEFSYPSIYSGPAGTPSYYDTDAAAEVEVEQEKAPMFSYISEMLMDEKLEEKKCMFVEMSAYQAMAKELGDLITYDTEAPYDFPLSDDSAAISTAENASSPEFPGEEDINLDVNLVDSWIDEILNGPVPGELRDSPAAKTKFDNGFENFCSHTDPQLCTGAAWNNDKDSEASECQSSFLYGNSSLSAVGSENPARAREDGSGRSLLVDFKPVAMSSTNSGQHVPPVDLTNLLIRSSSWHFCLPL